MIGVGGIPLLILLVLLAYTLAFVLLTLASLVLLALLVGGIRFLKERKPVTATACFGLFIFIIGGTYWYTKPQYFHITQSIRADWTIPNNWTLIIPPQREQISGRPGNYHHEIKGVIVFKLTLPDGKVIKGEGSSLSVITIDDRVETLTFVYDNKTLAELISYWEKDADLPTTLSHRTHMIGHDDYGIQLLGIPAGGVHFTLNVHPE